MPDIFVACTGLRSLKWQSVASLCLSLVRQKYHPRMTRIPAQTILLIYFINFLIFSDLQNVDSMTIVMHSKSVIPITFTV